MAKHCLSAKKSWKKIALVSIVINLLLTAVGGSFAGYKIIQRINRGGVFG